MNKINDEHDKTTGALDPETSRPENEKERRKRKMAAQAEKIDSLNEELQQCREELAAAKETAAEMKDQYLRLQAEWDNFRRRTAKERIDLIENAGKNILTGFLPVVDDCQRALQSLHDADAANVVKAAIEGTELIYNKLTDYLKQQGVERIEARGAVFDTDFHEAVANFPVDDPEKKDRVIEVTQDGYTLNGKVIRYAKVVVGK